ncbi:MAG: DUF6436 domain-containing protein [Chromatiaceae bacterium]|nr:DUF6436 domain-containing protein [Chromatiaceae bacterium]
MRPQGRLIAALLLFAGWIALSSAALFYLGQRHYGEFAAAQLWHADPLLLSALALPVEDSVVLLHVMQEACPCNYRARVHQRALAQDPNLSQVQHHVINAEVLAQSGFQLPATPAVLVFINGKLHYAGPYASGPLCALDDSFILPILKQRVILPGLWLNGDATACRCLLKPS